jgi:hypothetical protein
MKRWAWEYMSVILGKQEAQIYKDYGTVLPKYKSDILLDPISQAPVAHACNPSCSRGRDQEDRGFKPAQANSLRDSISEKTITKKGLVEWLKV